jgi:hypothetical protein
MATLIQIGTVMILLYNYNPIAPIRKLETRHDGKKRDEAPFVLCFAMSYYLLLFRLFFVSLRVKLIR